MPTNRALLPQALEAGLKRVYFRRLNMIPTYFTQFMNIESSGRAFEDMLRAAGLGTLVLKPEGTAVSYDDPVQGARVRTVFLTFALGYRVTMEMMEDEETRIISQLPMELADATADHRERTAHGPLNDAFTGASFTGLDGAALCGNHTNLKTGTVQSNSLTPAVGLSVSAMQSLLTAFETFTNESDRFVAIRPSLLVVPTGLHYTAAQVLDSQERPDTTDRAINTVSTTRTGVSYLSDPYLTDVDNYFLLAAKGQHDLVWWNRKAATRKSAVDFDTQDLKTHVHYRGQAAFYDWRGVMGCAP